MIPSIDTHLWDLHRLTPDQRAEVAFLWDDHYRHGLDMPGGDRARLNILLGQATRPAAVPVGRPDRQPVTRRAA